MDRFTFKKFLNEGKTQVLNQALSATANGALKDIKTKIYRAQDIISNELGIKLDKVGGKARADKEFLRGPLGLDRESVENNVKNAGLKMSSFLATSAQVLSNLYAQGKDKLANSLKDTKKAAAFNAILLGAILCKKNGIDSSTILDILSAAGVE